jgi:hypothetical protein
MQRSPPNSPTARSAAAAPTTRSWPPAATVTSWTRRCATSCGSAPTSCSPPGSGSTPPWPPRSTWPRTCAAPARRALSTPCSAGSPPVTWTPGPRSSHPVEISTRPATWLSATATLAGSSRRSATRWARPPPLSSRTPSRPATSGPTWSSPSPPAARTAKRTAKRAKSLRIPSTTRCPSRRTRRRPAGRPTASGAPGHRRNGPGPPLARPVRGSRRQGPAAGRARRRARCSPGRLRRPPESGRAGPVRPAPRRAHPGRGRR